MNEVGFFEVSPGNKSIMRAAFAWLMLNGTAMAWYVLISTHAAGVGAACAVFGTVTTVATGLKIIQKGQEQKQEGATNV